MINENDLLNELKKRIAISNFELENENQNIFPKKLFEDWRKYIMNKKKVLNTIGILAVAFILLGISANIYAKIQWNIGFNEYKNREYQTSLATIKDAEENGYVQNIDMEYVVQDNIGVKLTSLLMTDEYVEITADFKFPEDMEINTETFSYGFAVYDNEKNVYSVAPRVNIYGVKMGKIDTYTPYMYKEMGIDYDRFNLYDKLISDGGGVHNIYAENHNLISKIELNSSKRFPKSKKLFVRINNLGFTMVEISNDSNVDNYKEDFDISNCEWIFEVDVPEKFYERTTTELALKDEIPNLSIEKIEVSEVYLMVRGTLNGFYDMIQQKAEIPVEMTELDNKTIYITDEEGNTYYEKTYGLTGKKDCFRKRFEITKDMLNKKLFLNVKIGEKIYTSELIKK